MATVTRERGAAAGRVQEEGAADEAGEGSAGGEAVWIGGSALQYNGTSAAETEGVGNAPADEDTAGEHAGVVAAATAVTPGCVAAAAAQLGAAGFIPKSTSLDAMRDAKAKKAAKEKSPEPAE